MKSSSQSFFSKNNMKRLISFFIIFMLYFTFLLGVEKTSMAQISIQKVTPAKPAEQPKQFQSQPEPQFQVFPSLKVTYPNGGEIWEIGKQYTIKWQSQNFSGNVKIMLKWEGGTGRWYSVVENIPNTGSYMYRVPENIYEGPKFKVYVMSLDNKIQDSSDGFFTIIYEAGVKRLRPPVFSFIFPKYYDNPNTKEVLVKGKPYNIIWKQVRQADADLKNIKIVLQNRQANQWFPVTNSTPNTGSYQYTVPQNLPDGLYLFLIMPTSEEFMNQSAEFYIAPNHDVDLLCEIREVKIGWKERNYYFYTDQHDYLEFEIWVMNRGTQHSPVVVPIIWRIINEPDNTVILQHSAHFFDVYPNRYYKTKLKYTYKEAGGTLFYSKNKSWGPGPFIIEAEADPKRELNEPEITRRDNIARKTIFYDPHIKGGRVK